MNEKVLLKDLLFNREKVAKLAKELSRAHSAFHAEAFVEEVTQAFPRLELKARISWMAECLSRHLPQDYRKAAGILIRALPPPNDPTLSDGDFGDFIHAPYGEFIARYGCTREHLAFSLKALREITKRFSVEDAIRYFLNAFPDETLDTLATWSEDPHYHVRRLCSEGTRPRLPWSQKITLPITAPLPILDRLFCDPTRFVVRSVANHLNDISKADPALAVKILARWKRSGKQSDSEMEYILRHSLRSLIKRGDTRAMQLLGVSHKARIRVIDMRVPRQVGMNTALEFSLTVHADQGGRFIADYALHFSNKSGQLSSRKVFKLKTIQLAQGERVTLTKKHMLREHMTTRKLHRGRHDLEIQINGKPMAKRSFQLL